ncbi:MAG: DEAD/DEAH box helicase, partial [Planctomycetota bacterium]
MEFTQLQLAEPILQAVADRGYETASPIQAQTIPHILDGHDVLGCAQTGTGKTAAFALPTLHRLLADTGKSKPGKRKPRCLVLAPTRELAAQIAESFQDYGQRTDLTGVVIYGGVNQNPQVRKLQRGVDIVVATPGRLLDLIEQGFVDLSAIETFVLDEADRMLDMGFVPDIRKVSKLIPKNRQTLLFSATMPPPIEKLANDLLRDPVKISTAPPSSTADRVEQGLYFVDKAHKPAMLAHLLNALSISRTIVFTRTKYGADKLVKKLRKLDIPSEAIHGNKTQNARQRSLDRFKSGQCHVLVATDIASRGIDVDNISHVFNYDLPDDPESYVHRIGRTARAGASGMAITFCDKEERANLTAVQKVIQMKVPILTDFPEHIPEGAG